MKKKQILNNNGHHVIVNGLIILVDEYGVQKKGREVIRFFKQNNLSS